MTTTPDDSAAPQAGPGLPELLGAAAIGKSLKVLGEAIEGHFRPRAEEAFLASDGTLKAQARVDRVGNVGEATRKKTPPVARVTDEKAYVGYVEETYPTEVEHTITITLGDGFGVAALVRALREIVDEYPGLASLDEGKTVRERFRKKHLTGLPSNTLTAEELNKTTGVLVAVPGVTVMQPEPTGAFVLNGCDEDAQRRIIAALDGAMLAQLAGASVPSPAIEDGRTITGEEVDGQ